MTRAPGSIPFGSYVSPLLHLAMKTFWVYMVLCDDASYYIGVTNDVDRRVAEHNLGQIEDCYTYRRRPVHLVYASEFRDANEAIKSEKQIKGWTRAKKAALAAGDFEALRRLSRRKAQG